MQDYAKAIELHAGHVKAYNSCGNIYYDMQEYEKAAEDFARAAELHPDQFTLHFNLARACRKMGDYGKAVENYTRSVELNPEFAGGFYGRGLAYSAQNSTMVACIDFYRAALLFLKDGNKDGARACAEGIKNAGPSSPLLPDLMKKIEKDD